LSLSCGAALIEAAPPQEIATVIKPFPGDIAIAV